MKFSLLCFLISTNVLAMGGGIHDLAGQVSHEYHPPTYFGVGGSSSDHPGGGGPNFNGYTPGQTWSNKAPESARDWVPPPQRPPQSESISIPNENRSHGHRRKIERHFSPPLQRSYPEFVFIPALHRAVTFIRTIQQIGEGLEIGRIRSIDQNGYPKIQNPNGPPVEQSMTQEALEARKAVEDGAILYKLGTREKSWTGEQSQYWSLENPMTTPNYTDRYGMFPENYKNADFIERARVKPGSTFITRESPPITDPKTGLRYEGGGMEVVVEPRQVFIEGHHGI